MHRMHAGCTECNVMGKPSLLPPSLVSTEIKVTWKGEKGDSWVGGRKKILLKTP